MRLVSEPPVPASLDPLALYFREIGGVARLDAAQERQLGHGIEVCRARRRRALAAMPGGIDALLARAAGLTAREIETLVALPGGEPPSRAQRTRILRSLAHLRRLRSRLATSAAARRSWPDVASDRRSWG